MLAPDDAASQFGIERNQFGETAGIHQGCDGGRILTAEAPKTYRSISRDQLTEGGDQADQPQRDKRRTVDSRDIY